MTYQDRYGRWALVIGASATVGEQFARQLGAKGMNVAMVARRKEQLDRVGAEIAQAHGVETRTIALDLLEDAAIEKLRDATADLEIGFLVINANRHQVGHFDLMSLEDKQTMARMNFEMPIVLSHHYGGDMVARKRGAIVMLNEVHCFSPLDFDAVFQGTKAGLRLFTESLWAEYRKSNVRVASVHLSGIEESDSFNAKITPTRRRLIKLLGASMEPRAIVEGALEQLERGKLMLVPDTWTFLNIYTLKFTDLMRLIGGKFSIITQSAFFSWFMDGEGSKAGQGKK
ncbi:MAG: SDR family NAD(P)-dependent oxidoreductase [Myxococcota bacterium]